MKPAANASPCVFSQAAQPSARDAAFHRPQVSQPLAGGFSFHGAHHGGRFYTTEGAQS